MIIFLFANKVKENFDNFHTNEVKETFSCKPQNYHNILQKFNFFCQKIEKLILRNVMLTLFQFYQM